VPGYPEIVRPLNRLTGKKAKFTWSPEANEAFVKIKEMMKSPEVLKFPDFNKGFIITTDASKHSISGVLEQVRDGAQVVIDAAGRALNKAEENYSTTKRELLAIVWTVKKWKIYLKSSKKIAIFRSEHLPLGHLKKMTDCQGRLQRWIWQLEEIPHKIDYLPGP
jgi:hypothetical protein